MAAGAGAAGDVAATTAVSVASVIGWPSESVVVDSLTSSASSAASYALPVVDDLAAVSVPVTRLPSVLTSMPACALVRAVEVSTVDVPALKPSNRAAAPPPAASAA